MGDSGCGMFSVGVARSLWVCLWPQLVCLWPKYGFSGCCIALVGVVLLQWVWHDLSRCGMV